MANKRWTEEDLERLKKRGFKVIETNKVVSDKSYLYKDPELSEFSLDIPKRGRPKISDPDVVVAASRVEGYETINGNVPSKSNCYHIAKTAGHGTLIKSDALKKYEESFLWQCQKYRDKNISAPFAFHVKVYYPSKRSDLDNAMKILLDCLQRVKAIKNDNNCFKIVAEKYIDKVNPRVEFKIIAS